MPSLPSLRTPHLLYHRKWFIMTLFGQVSRGWSWPFIPSSATSIRGHTGRAGDWGRIASLAQEMAQRPQTLTVFG